ncbi:unnamed protein product [Enterobius vermicularis]|uniref:Aspartyl aminopeptidase n=1 Tax=Enterobius vermicularis TaxID=51028 RepID=A0A0N4V014_ENTVE|nr:unnamed protein product [Enterobius vermicularis]
MCEQICCKSRKAAQDFMSFVQQAPTPFHAVEVLSSYLCQEKFIKLKENEHWNIELNGKYFVTRNNSTIFAFVVGGKYKPGNGFTMTAAHTDSPCLRVKPISKISSQGCAQVGVSVYGGGIWRTWFDRDLSLAGQVVFLKNCRVTRKLINIRQPLMYIPSLASHLNRNKDKFEWNDETDLRPILATLAEERLNEDSKNGHSKIVLNTNDQKDEEEKCLDSLPEEHHLSLLELISKEAGCDSSEILDFDLYLYDTQGPAICGIHQEFICSQRLDDLLGVYTTTFGLLESLKTKNLEHEKNIRLVTCFDNEEVGSSSAQGAESSLCEWIMRRICASDLKNSFEKAISNSYLLSVDNTHAVHPNYADKHEQNHKPTLGGGVVVKTNFNQRYATNSLTSALIKYIAVMAGESLQKIVVRNDMKCGSTIGPILASKLGIQAADVGCLQLAMHSIRELVHVNSVQQAINLFSVYNFKFHY